MSLRMVIAGVLLATVLLSWTTATPARAVDDPAASFEKFCAQWMEKLAVRERDNQKQIRWVRRAQGVEGEYTGYSSKHECFVKPVGEKRAVPVGKITYLELRYQKTGTSADLARLAAPRALEAIEVTEIFRYARGKWQY